MGPGQEEQQVRLGALAGHTHSPPPFHSHLLHTRHLDSQLLRLAEGGAEGLLGRGFGVAPY